MKVKRKSQSSEFLKDRSLIAHNNPKSPIAEQYRTIRTNIDFFKIDETIHSIVVTSAGPSEGKSTTASNLAIVMAQQGKKVLLIDADLRKPTAHYTFRLGNNEGLTTILTTHSNLQDTINWTDIENLFLVTSGPIPPNPAELLSSSSMKKLLAEAQELFDVVILDSPPVLNVTDAQILSSYCDGTIFVVASRQTDIEAAQEAKELLNKTKAKLLGIVLNRKSHKDKKRNRYYYSGTR